MHHLRPIFFYWDGGISPKRLKILKDCIYSTRVFNPYHTIILVSNSIAQEEFDPEYYIIVQKWNKDLFEGLPMSSEKVDKYMKAHPRDFSDLMRLVLLYQFGGTYIDTDDLAIKPISDTHNLVCRSYDPHTSFYNKITDEQCVPGFIREIPGFDHINTFPRNDCWHNWEPKSDFIKEMLWNEKFINNEEVVWIGGDFSWQSIANETCIKKLDTHKVDWNYGLTLLYLFEDFVAASSFWDRCVHGGEMCEIWGDMQQPGGQDWGFFKTDKETAMKFYKIVSDKYPNLSHMWLHSKDMNEEWFIEELNEHQKYAVSTWIYNDIKQKINVFSNNTDTLEM